MSAEQAIDAAIFTALDAALTEPVYGAGNVPDNIEDRYVVIGNGTMIEWDTDNDTGFEATITIHTWDTIPTSRGFYYLKLLMGEVYITLHRANLSVTGYNVLGLDYESSEAMLDPDGLTTHGVQQFRLKMEV